MSKTLTAGLTPEKQTEAGNLVLFAVIKSSSKYSHQGRVDGRPVAMEVTRLENDFYAFHLENGNRYRREDLTFYVKSSTGNLIKLR